MARASVTFTIVSLALSVLACGAAALVVDEDAGNCRRGHELVDESAATAMLQHSVGKAANAGRSAHRDELRRVARDAQEHWGRPHERLPPFPTLSPANAAELPWSSHDEFLEEPLRREDDGEDAKVKVVGKGIATVFLDSMSRPVAPDLLQHPSQADSSERLTRRREHDKDEAKHTAPSKPATQMAQKLASSESRDESLDEGDRSEDSAAQGTLSGEEAALDEPSYKALAAKRSHKEMKSFVQRIVGKLGYRTVSEGDLDGFVAYYSGEKGVQSVRRMQKEIIEIASKRGPWIVAGGVQASVALSTSTVKSSIGR